MIQNKLITASEMRAFHDISDSVYASVIDSQIISAQIQDIAGLLGERLFNAVLTTPASYTDLLEGGSYIYNGETKTNYGLKSVISHYANARYIFFGSVKDTPFSLVEKLEGSNSRPIDAKTRKDLYNINRDSAFKLWISVENFLIRTKEPLFIGCNKSKANNTFRISKITK